MHAKSFIVTLILSTSHFSSTVLKAQLCFSFLITSCQSISLKTFQNVFKRMTVKAHFNQTWHKTIPVAKKKSLVTYEIFSETRSCMVIVLFMLFYCYMWVIWSMALLFQNQQPKKPQMRMVNSTQDPVMETTPLLQHRSQNIGNSILLFVLWLTKNFNS